MYILHKSKDCSYFVVIKTKESKGFEYKIRVWEISKIQELQKIK